ncbi:hypothetical protein [Nocardiopsis halotolerans]|uniref:hypothetical protein n=1 Tax=Nocardiopsis halotolerans TaxID=124252 RepID=UPI00034712DB|nr:hypothetical protein [Nocardiopsis halotolerans]
MVESTEDHGPSETLHCISLGVQDSGLVGPGLGPAGTSFSQEDYAQVSTWRNRLARVASPEFASGETGPSYWYRRFGDGQGALLRRSPEENRLDGRGDRAQALVGARLNVPSALMVALDGWPEVLDRLEEPGRIPPGWNTVPSFALSGAEEYARRLDVEASAQPGLVNLVAAALFRRTDPLDVLVTAGGGSSLGERERLLLLWGLYRTTRDVVGTERRPRYAETEWSFSTYDPWPVRRGAVQERPRIAFRPPPPPERSDPGAFVDVLAPERDTSHHEIARWLVTRLGTVDGTLTDLGRELDRVGDDHHQILEYLSLLARPTVTTRTPAPPTTEPQPTGARGAAHEGTRPDTAGSRTDGGDGTSHRPDTVGHHQNPENRPSEASDRYRAPVWNPRRGPEPPHPGGYVPPQDVPGPPPAQLPPVETRVPGLLDELRGARDANRWAAIATELVRQYHHFPQHLVVRGHSRGTGPTPETVLFFLVVLILLLLVVLLVVNLTN